MIAIIHLGFIIGLVIVYCNLNDISSSIDIENELNNEFLCFYRKF